MALYWTTVTLRSAGEKNLAFLRLNKQFFLSCKFIIDLSAVDGQ